MGFCTLIAECGSCHKTFTCNPKKVPSFNNVPFCKPCVDAANPARIANGLEPVKYSSDAYDCCDEYEL